MPVTLICQVCTQSFSVQPYKAGSARFCSHRCRLAGLHERLRQERQKPAHVCHYCGRTYRRAPSGAGLYCSQRCAKEAQSNTADSVFKRVDQSGGPSACWPWQGPVSRWGYGAIRVSGVGHNAHRVAYEATYGAIGAKIVVMHTCDNRLCCNPAHLRAATQKENIADMVSKGRAAWQKPDHGATPTQAGD